MEKGRIRIAVAKRIYTSRGPRLPHHESSKCTMLAPYTHSTLSGRNTNKVIPSHIDHHIRIDQLDEIEYARSLALERCLAQSQICLGRLVSLHSSIELGAGKIECERRARSLSKSTVGDLHNEVGETIGRLVYACDPCPVPALLFETGSFTSASLERVVTAAVPLHNS